MEAPFYVEKGKAPLFENSWSHMVIRKGYVIQSPYTSTEQWGTIVEHAVNRSVVSRPGTDLYFRSETVFMIVWHHFLSKNETTI